MRWTVEKTQRPWKPGKSNKPAVFMRRSRLGSLASFHSSEKSQTVTIAAPFHTWGSQSPGVQPRPLDDWVGTFCTEVCLVSGLDYLQTICTSSQVPFPSSFSGKSTLRCPVYALTSLCLAWKMAARTPCLLVFLISLNLWLSLLSSSIFSLVIA